MQHSFKVHIGREVDYCVLHRAERETYRFNRKEDHTSNNKDDHSALRQVGRWREVTIPVQGHITDTTCTASIPR